MNSIKNFIINSTTLTKVFVSLGIIAGLLVLVAGGFSIWWFNSPQYVYNEISQSIKDGDFERFEKVADFEALKENSDEISSIDEKATFRTFANTINESDLADNFWDAMTSDKLEKDGDRYTFSSTIDYTFFVTVSVPVDFYISNTDNGWKLTEIDPGEVDSSSFDLGSELGGGSEDEDEDKFTKYDVAYGESQELNGLRFSVYSAELNNVFTMDYFDTSRPMEIRPLDESNNLLLIWMSIENVSKEADSINLTYEGLKLVTPEDVKYDTASGIQFSYQFVNLEQDDMPDGYVANRNLNPGQKTIGVLIYEIPKDLELADLTVEYEKEVYSFSDDEDDESFIANFNLE